MERALTTAALTRWFAAPRPLSRPVPFWMINRHEGLTGDEAIMVAFEENARDLSRVGGN